MLQERISILNPTINIHRDIADNIITKMEEEKAILERQSAFLNKKHLVSCRIMYAYDGFQDEWDIMMQERIVFPYTILYRLNLDGKKYLIASPEYAVGVAC